VATGITEDVLTFERIMDAVGAPRNRAKTVSGRVLERLLRLKPNGNVRSYTPLARFFELELLVMGIEGKKVLWTTLRDLAGVERFSFDELLARADAQRSELEPFRVRAGVEALR
jgi:hypothetical protein